MLGVYKTRPVFSPTTSSLICDRVRTDDHYHTHAMTRTYMYKNTLYTISGPKSLFVNSIHFLMPLVSQLP